MLINSHVGALGVLSLFVLLGSRAPDAQTPNVLAKVKTLKCVFPVYAIGTWKDGEPHAEVRPSNLSLWFDEIDTDEGTARVIGSIDITARLSLWSLTFMEMSSWGALYITTVFDKQSRPGKFTAVHTRHEYTPASQPELTSSPEQYYGECAIAP